MSKSAFTVLKVMKSAHVRLAPFEPSSSFAREFLRVAQTPRVAQHCPDLKLTFEIVPEPIRPPTKDKFQSKVTIELNNDNNNSQLVYDASDNVDAYDIVRDINFMVPPIIAEEEFHFVNVKK